MDEGNDRQSDTLVAIDAYIGMNETKKFVGYWSAGAFVTPDGKDRVAVIEGTANFTEELGYDADDKQGIEGLSEGETWYSNDYGWYHWIKRVE